jgi:arylsulfatase A
MLSALAAIAIAQAQRPNIVVFYCDDLGYREIGAYGLKNAKTPHIDQLAKESAKYTRFYSGAPVCAPARAILMTGKHSGHVLIRGNKEVGGWGFNDPEGQAPLPASEFTMAEAFQKGGYATGAFGKWGLGGPMSEGHPLNQGFDRFFGYLCQRQAHNHFPAYLWSDQFVYTLEGNPQRGIFGSRFDSSRFPKPGEPIPARFFDQFKGRQYGPDVIEDKAVEWLKQKRDKPFFLYFSIALPHTALQAPEELVSQFPREWDKSPYIGGSGYLPNERPRATYAAMLKKIDDSMGRIRQTLKEIGADRNTIIVFTSDNGTTFLKQVDAEFFGSTAGLRGKKMDLYEGGIRVPLLIHRPGVWEGGSESDRFWYGPDLMPTLIDFAGLPIPRGLDGVSFDRRDSRDGLYFEYPENNHSQAVIMDRRWKAIRPNLRQSLDIEVYDLRADEAEAMNLAAKRPDLVEQAKRIFSREHRVNSDFKLNRIDKQP